MRSILLLGGLTIPAAVLCAAPALAQRAQDNVTTQSGDAFGRSVGNEKSGLYTSDDVRGFNPVDAGNVRIEGLYFDQVDKVSTRLIDGNTIRVGAATLRYPFPAPTGLVDYSLTQPRDRTSYSLQFDTGSTAAIGPGGSVEFKQPLDGERWGVSGGVGYRNWHRPEGGVGLIRTFGATVAFRPAPDTEVLLFGGDFLYRSDEAHPALFLAGSGGPPKLKRGEDLSQSWTGRDSDTWLWGGIAKVPLSGKWRLEVGLFDTRRTYHHIYADIATGVLPDGSASGHRIVADAGTSDASLSGEVRLVREWHTDTASQRLIASLRGRHRTKLFGGSRIFQFGPTDLNVPQVLPEPVYVIGPKNHDTVNQLTLGLSYSLVTGGGLTLDGSIAQSRYRKAVDFSDPALGDLRTRDDPTTWSLDLAQRIAPSVTVYAGIAHGQEEALIAPDIAVNRSEAPPAIHTRQVEAGVKLGLTAHLTLIAGAFQITKPYYNLDAGLRYRQLGTLRNRGIELSLTGQVVPGLTVVGGTLLLDPRISGEVVDAGQLGPRPVGQIRRRSVLNIDWRPDAGQSPWSFDLALESLSGRTGNALNTLSAPARTTFNLGARYRLHLGKSTFLLRPLLINVTNNYGWNVSTSGAWSYTQPRAFSMQVIADF
ncbi:TonB-dependent receptor domain-containing protein [Novosphingobium sp.]|uniref:TonB-dependent receptor domain-containing protein n=1 Tax=Novosphingobium sp. TaxID=1874826 RepID=UPI0035B1BED1